MDKTVTSIDGKRDEEIQSPWGDGRREEGRLPWGRLEGTREADTGGLQVVSPAGIWEGQFHGWALRADKGSEAGAGLAAFASRHGRAEWQRRVGEMRLEK